MNIQDVVLDQKHPITDFNNMVVGDTTVNLGKVLAAASLVSTNVHFQVPKEPLKVKDFKDASKLSKSNSLFDIRNWSKEEFGSWFSYKPSEGLECYVLFITPTKYIEMDVHLNEMEITFKTNVTIPTNAVNHLSNELIKMKGIALLLDALDTVQQVAGGDVRIFTSTLPTRSVVSLSHCKNEDIDAFKLSGFKWVIVKKDFEFRLYHIETKAYFELEFGRHQYGVKDVYLDGLEHEQIETLHKDLTDFLSTPKEPVTEEIEEVNTDNPDRVAIVKLIDSLRSMVDEMNDEDFSSNRFLHKLYGPLGKLASEIDCIQERNSFMRDFNNGRQQRATDINTSDDDIRRSRDLRDEWDRSHRGRNRSQDRR